MNEIHIYRMRHIFKGDDLVAKYDSQTRSIRVFEAFANLKDEIRSWMIRTHSIFASTLVGDEQVIQAAPLMEFPDEIRAQMTPELGDRTPVAIDYARKHFPREEFVRRYHGRAEYETGKPAAPAPKTPQADGNHPAVNEIGLPVGSPANKKELAAALKAKGIAFDGRAKVEELVKIYQDSLKPAAAPANEDDDDSDGEEKPEA